MKYEVPKSILVGPLAPYLGKLTETGVYMDVLPYPSIMHRDLAWGIIRYLGKEFESRLWEV